MAKKHPVNTNYYWKLEDKMKAEQEKERKKKMKVSGKSVFKLREIIVKNPKH